MSLLPGRDTPKKNHRLLRITDVINLTGLPKSTIYLKIKNNEFPNQVSIGSRSVAWVENEVNEWIEKNIANRNLNS
ncbi:AlpA family transcriptional regulator [Salmonella enterica]|uniref:AlpA family transcriptional regulator n=3 Tax=Salmonella enterica I TaxID=59201 RepID=A0A3T6IS92_SALET|nr:AlpA family transcriptional regulator [Salmonella enterica]EAB9250702.1 AlpA family transcriptional regulator [Salmonella enterica subsp. enterica serovar Typhimurium]EBH2885372.1 AlpA family transcriptional regulator [Salmonella enterica subsp. enterica]EBH8160258.1 AlpA family transcriptional regulator [Salmonella enterica subsp. enterica serovar Typhimurium str. UK-1]EBH8576451.1 AlpA family transcriptional regulator [Salmonella enterica subsp. enterica serovar Braenderup]ECA7654789.1 Al